ncbi:unnamed protein product [Symbiodinium sp. CCMP2456]|nr:unnamed protein product [Symbiodinium sp. CCMP2456]
MSWMPWSGIATGTRLCQSATPGTVLYDARCSCCRSLVEQVCKLSTEKDELLHECGNLRRDNYAQWSETEMLQNACISLHNQNSALWAGAEMRGNVCSSLACQNEALWTDFKKLRKELLCSCFDSWPWLMCVPILVARFEASGGAPFCSFASFGELQAEQEATQERALKAEHCPDMMRGQEEESGASSASESTRASDGDDSPQACVSDTELDDEQPNIKEDLPGALRANTGDIHEGASSPAEIGFSRRTRTECRR